MIQPRDAWTLARLLTGHPLNGERDALPEQFRPIADRLDALPASDREAAWDSYLCGQSDPDAWTLALASVDPSGPPPEEDEREDAWLPLRLARLEPPEPFPVDVLPEAAARLVTEGAASIGCPTDFLGVPVLVVAAGVIGRSVSLRLKEDYFVSASLYAVCIGPPSDGKTPALKTVSTAVHQIDETLETRYAQARERWEESCRPGPDGKKPKPPPAPRPQRIDVDDITMEALPGILADNPRGLIMIRDELTALMLGMNQFKAGEGNDRQVLLKMWSNASIKKDRVNQEDHVPIRCNHPCLSIVGGMPPDMLGELADPKGRTDGFLDRFLLAYPEPVPVPEWTSQGIPEDVREPWCDLVSRLWHRQMRFEDGRLLPHVAQFSTQAQDAWLCRYDAHVAEMNDPGFPPSLRGPWGKMREYAGRLALILALLNHAADPTADPEVVPEVGPTVVEDAWRLVDYFKSQVRRVYATMDLGPNLGGGPVVKAIVGWLVEHRKLSFSERDIKQARRWIRDDDLATALKYLEKRNAIQPREPSNEAPTAGRPASPFYEVNPALLDTQNTQNTQNERSDRSFEDSEYFENAQGGGS